MRGFMHLIFLLVMLVTISVFGPARLAAEELPSATGAFKRGDYPRALALFREAEQSGDDSAKLKFNLGVTLFKLGRYTEASEYFWLLVPEPQWRDLAEYNLGLVARRQGDQLLAAKFFRRVSGRAASPQLQRLAALQLGSPAVEPVTQVRPWLAMASINGGQDGNPYAVKTELLGEGAVGEDNFLELFGWGQYRLAGTEADGWRLQGYGFTRRYSELDSLNLASLSTLLVRDIHWRDWALETGAGAEWVTLGGERVSQQLQLVGRAKRDFGATSVQLSYIPAYYTGGDNYSYLDGWRQRFSAGARRETFGADFGIYYLYDTNDREDLQQAADYYSYSPVRHAFGSDVRWRFLSRWELRAGVEYRYSVYGGQNRVVDDAGNLLEFERESDRFKSWVSTRYRLTPRLSLDGKLLNIDNRENRELYDFDKTEMSLGVSYVF
ncbi:tetratricopeptide repeat protein [Microbulbifer sp. CAU 1566]|uniref:tetratricopeptide repeat protein n=1 Tax=Microbulbifer sp. CAU 1566 TaxID=2933269 RepID=UPI002006958D|nr:tetratricopeptide repeat protein [Microbulbifer sp. CAU 1566]MCK7598898.1 tetratricopeptide repeat protein [Microbulbifer sp. CAU 1566]